MVLWVKDQSSRGLLVKNLVKIEKNYISLPTFTKLRMWGHLGRVNQASFAHVACCRVAAWDTTTNGIIIKDHKNSSGQLRLPPLGSSTDVVRGQVYLFYGVISSSNGDCQGKHTFAAIEDEILLRNNKMMVQNCKWPCSLKYQSSQNYQ